MIIIDGCYHGLMNQRIVVEYVAIVAKEHSQNYLMTYADDPHERRDQRFAVVEKYRKIS